MKARGHLVCAGVSLPIVDVRLEGGEVKFYASGRVERDVDLSGPVTVFGEDGTGLMQGGNVDMGVCMAGARVALTANLRMDVCR